MPTPTPKVRPGKKSPPRKPSAKQSSRIGQRLIAGMEDLLATMKAGGRAAVEKKFTVRKVKIAKFEVPTLDRADVLEIRTSLGVSQPLFASLLGVSPALVKGWEQGLKVPSGIAQRFLAEIRRNPNYWKGRVQEAAKTV